MQLLLKLNIFIQNLEEIPTMFVYCQCETLSIYQMAFSKNHDRDTNPSGLCQEICTVGRSSGWSKEGDYAMALNLYVLVDTKACVLWTFLIAKGRERKGREGKGREGKGKEKEKKKGRKEKEKKKKKGKERKKRREGKEGRKGREEGRKEKTEKERQRKKDRKKRCNRVKMTKLNQCVQYSVKPSEQTLQKKLGGSLHDSYHSVEDIYSTNWIQEVESRTSSEELEVPI
ncbi:hypothetical protein llap_3499 [Limosa lapponica baueri]|uniref:Uncharacterized protein n=1 Tax=Limosa lapponica baueri TaxID=1758121 RepID=A0A2I0UJF2_LIMLA|nr:hypothetical protein llap_3499 [Limosa lapponica baueri]